MPFTKATDSAADSDETLDVGEDEDNDNNNNEPTYIAEMAREESDDQIINEVSKDYLLSVESSRVGQTAVTKVRKHIQLLAAYNLRNSFFIAS